MVMFAGALLLAACGGQAAPPTQQGGGPPATSGQTPAPPDGNGGGEGMVVATINVQSGPVAGSQEATGPKVDCNISPTGSGATYLDLESLRACTR